jgi:hypothetical protein
MADLGVEIDGLDDSLVVRESSGFMSYWLFGEGKVEEAAGGAGLVFTITLALVEGNGPVATHEEGSIR